MTKPRYIHQRDSYSCGPTALYNVMQWAGEVYMTKKALMGMCGGREEIKKSGTDASVFNVVLENLPGIQIKKISFKSKLGTLDDHIDKGGIVIISYITPECGHYAVIIGRTKTHYITVNTRENRTISNICRKNMRKMLDRSYFCLGTFACSVQWFVKKDE
jgi:hypothetical protein